jgi:FKBP-type peptidyl-prolyl cis-trans isomerase
MTLPGWVQYRILKAGDGKKATYADTVEVSYRRSDIDGTESLEGLIETAGSP